MLSDLTRSLGQARRYIVLKLGADRSVLFLVCGVYLFAGEVSEAQIS